MAWLRLAIGLLVLMLGPATAAAGGDEPVTLRLGPVAIDGSRYMKDILALSQEIEKRTRGAGLAALLGKIEAARRAP